MQKKEELNEMLSDPKMRDRLEKHLKSKKRILGNDSPFSELLQGMVNVMLAGEMDDFMDEETASGRKNKRNGGKVKRVTSEFGALDIYTPRDRNGEFTPEIVNGNIWSKYISR